ncbi:MAG TPA: hypothetical protein VK472_03825 [Allosphingosinicella sp.]|nr:hypothetical protein [Allosphingosinicella sp.]
MATSGPGGRIDIGSVVSRGFEAIGHNFPAFLGLSILLGGLPAFAFSYLSGPNLDGQNALGFGGGGMTIAAWLVQIVATSFLQAVIVRSSILTLSGRDGDIGGSIVAAFGLILPLIGLSILSGLVITIGLVLLIVPGIIAYVALSVAVPAMVEEGRGITDCMERSAELTKGSRWQIFLLLLILVVAYFVLAAGLGAASIVSEEAGILQFVAEAVVGTANALFMSTMTAALYVELRTVKEGATTEGLAAIFE